eukprot:9486318-Pyramimonas_sp.AAC.1
MPFRLTRLVPAEALVMRVMELYALMEGAADATPEQIPGMLQFCPKVLLMDDFKGAFNHSFNAIK